MPVDLRKCKRGDKLISKHFLVLEYFEPLDKDGHFYDHRVLYPNGEWGTRVNSGHVFENEARRLPEDHDIVKIIPTSDERSEFLKAFDKLIDQCKKDESQRSLYNLLIDIRDIFTVSKEDVYHDALERITLIDNITNGYDDGDKNEIEEARDIAGEAIIYTSDMV